MNKQKNNEENLENNFKDLQDLLLRIADEPQLNAFGERKLNPLKTFENRFTWKTVRTAFDEAEKIGSGLVYLQQKNSIPQDEFKIGIISSNTISESVLDLACVMYNVTQVCIEDELSVQELELCVEKVDFSILFASENEIEKILEIQKNGFLKNLKHIYSFTEKQKLKENSAIESYCDILELGQNNRTEWKTLSENSVYGIFFDIHNNFNLVEKTQKEVLLDILEIYEKIPIEECLADQETYISLNGSCNYFEKAFKFYMLIVRSQIAFPSLFQNYLVDIYLAQPTIVLANFSANYQKIQRYWNNKEIDFQKQVKILQSQKDGFLKAFLKSFIFSKDEKSMRFRKVKYVISINESYYHDVNKLLQECLDTSKAEFIKNIHLLEVGSLFSLENVKLKDEKTLKKFQKNNQGKLILDLKSLKYSKINKQDEFSTQFLATIQDGSILINGVKEDFVILKNGQVVETRQLESYYRNKNPFIDDLYIYGDSQMENLVALLDINNLSEQLKLSKKQNENENLKKQMLELLEEYRNELNLGPENKITQVYIDESNWRQRNLTDKFGNKKLARFKTFYSSELNNMKKEQKQFDQFINNKFNDKQFE